MTLFYYQQILIYSSFNITEFVCPLLKKEEKRKPSNKRGTIIKVNTFYCLLLFCSTLCFTPQLHYPALRMGLQGYKAAKENRKNAHCSGDCLILGLYYNGISYTQIMSVSVTVSHIQAVVI